MKGYRKEMSTGKSKKKKKGKGNDLDSSDEDQKMNRDGIFEIKESKEKFSSYFVGQLVLISNNELLIKQNSSHIRTMLESMECTDDFIY